MPDPNPAALTVLDPQVPRVTSLAGAMSLALSRAREIDDPDPDPYGYLQEIDAAFPNSGIMEPQWTARPNDPRWIKRVRARGRKSQVSARFLKGDSVPEIAQALSVSEATVYRDLTNLQMEWRERHMRDIEALAGQDLARLDMFMQKLAPAIDRGDVQAIKAGLDIVKERGSILGYRAGLQVDMEEFVRSAAESAGLDPNEAIIVARRISVNYRS